MLREEKEAFKGGGRREGRRVSSTCVALQFYGVKSNGQTVKIH